MTSTKPLLIVFMLSVSMTCSAASTAMHAAIIASTSAAVAAANTHAHHHMSSIFMQKYDYLVVCEASYIRRNNGTYKYFCANKPKKDTILYTEVTYYNGWPDNIIYYMQEERK